MKLYAKLKRWEGGREEKLGSNQSITLELYRGNNLTFVIGINEEGINVIDETHPQRKEWDIIAHKGKKQKTAKLPWKCIYVHDHTKGGCDFHD